MSRVIGLIACGFTLSACSASVPSLDFLKSSPANTALRFESVPPGAEVKVSGQTCRTPCELNLQVAEVSATFTRRGYQPQTISVGSEGGVFSAAQFVPNPVHVDLRPLTASKQIGAKVAAAGTNPAAPKSADAPVSSSPAEATTSTTTTTWSPAEVR